MITRFLTCTLIALACFTACKKKTNNIIIPSQSITLDSLIVSGKTVTLKWSNPQGDSQQVYLVYRYSDTTTNPDAVFSVDKNTTQFTDSLALAPLITYKVVAQFSKSTITSNSQSYARTDINFLPFTPTDVLFDRAAHQLFLFGEEIAVYDIPSGKILKQIIATTLSGTCDLATYNGAKELYTPQSNGRLIIYNTATMTQVDSINVGGWLTSVVYNNGLLFITTSGSDSGIKVYNRTTKQKIAQTPSGKPERIRLSPGTNSDFYGVTSYYDEFISSFSNTGSYVTQKHLSDSIHEVAAPLFEIFPDGSKILSSSYGNIFDTGWHYITSLPRGYDWFSSFDFDVTHQLVYAGVYYTKHILIYSMSDYHLANTINTQGYPLHVFYNNGSVISISITQWNNSGPGPSFAFIEQF